jgi:carbonic anhydrase
MPGLDKLLRGIIQYHATTKSSMLQQFKKVKNNPEPKAVMFSCMDSRLIMTRLIQSDVGDMFLVRNAGNLVPNNDSLSFDTVTTEPGALELGCIINNIRHVVVCGHSDCKAMNALFEMRRSVQRHEGTPLQVWLKRHGARTVAKFEELEKVGGVGPITFQGETPAKTFDAYIDPDNNFAPVDKFSQVNTLQQLQNIASYPFLQNKLENGDVRLHAFWFDIYRGDFYAFSRTRKHFLLVAEDNYEHLVEDGDGVRG